jgi:phage repressor protein C with HTH and peptisase S24 domain
MREGDPGPKIRDAGEIPTIIPGEDLNQLRVDIRCEYVPLLGETKGGILSLEGDKGYAVGAAPEYIRVPGAMHGQIALRIRGESMAPDYPSGSIVLVGGPVVPREGEELPAIVFLMDEAGDFAGHTLKMVRRQGRALRLRPLNEDYVTEEIPLERMARVLGILKRLV